MSFAVVAFAVSSALAADVVPECPKENPELATKSVPGGSSVNIEWESKLAFDAMINWMNFEGKEDPAIVLPAGLKQIGGSFPGHAFRIKSFNDDLIMEYVVPSGEGPHKVVIDVCGDLANLEQPLYPEGKEAEFESLVHDQNAPCVGPSREWSCIRRLSHEDWQARGTDGYGFLENETTPNRVGLQTDASYVKQISMVPKVSAFGPGYLKMTMPASMREPLLEFWQKTKAEAEMHEAIPGGYTNVDKVPMTKLNLDKYQNIRMMLVKEMQQVMQWWTQMRVRHTSTYGIRIYHRGSMLINHVDRVDTHLASAVIQVDQDVDEDGGWPLEVLLGNKTVGEVYLQPGEMVLYEGAWIRHGRPMRFKGEYFANIFSHFAPFEWNGPGGWEPDTTKPLPQYFHGYEPGRCDTIADLPGMSSACVVTDIMDSQSHPERDEL